MTISLHFCTRAGTRGFHVRCRSNTTPRFLTVGPSRIVLFRTEWRMHYAKYERSMPSSVAVLLNSVRCLYRWMPNAVLPASAAHYWNACWLRIFGWKRVHNRPASSVREPFPVENMHYRYSTIGAPLSMLVMWTCAVAKGLASKIIRSYSDYIYYGGSNLIIVTGADGLTSIFVRLPSLNTTVMFVLKIRGFSCAEIDLKWPMFFNHVFGHYGVCFVQLF